MPRLPRSMVGLLPFVAFGLVAGCTDRSADTAAGVADSVSADSAAAVTTVVPVYTDTLALRTGAQGIVDAFAASVAQARGGRLAPTPAVQVNNTPALIYFDGDSNIVVVPWWESAPEEMRAVFRTFAGGTDSAGAQLFRVNFNRFLVAHEASHWFARHTRTEPTTLYDAENQANRLAVAFWRTQPGGDALLDEVERLSAAAAERLPDPTPAGQDPVQYFGANYRELGNDPLKYGYYQFRFMRDAVRARATLDFATMVADSTRTPR